MCSNQRRYIMAQNIKRGLKEAQMISGEGFAGGKGHMDVAVILGKDPDIPDIPGYPKDFASNMLFCNWCRLEEGAICGSHPHVTNEEYYYVIKGRGRMEIKNPDGTVESYEAGENEAILMRAGGAHSFENIGQGDCIFLAICGGLVPREWIIE
jgi:mannose-6-phosphate isomerase-like protein (cupin superfamily)